MDPQFQYIYELLSPNVRVRALKPDCPPFSGFVTSPQALAAFGQMSSRGWDCYVGLNPTRSGCAPTAANVEAWRFLLVDLDPAISGYKVGLDDCHSVWQNLAELVGVAPKCEIVDSGRGIQLWVYIDQDIPLDVPRIQAASRKLLLLCDPQRTSFLVDPSGGDLARIARLPGTINQKSQTRAALIGIVQLVGTRPIPASAIIQFADEQSTEVFETEEVETWREAWPHLSIRAQQFIEEGTTQGSRHEALWHTGRKLRELGVSRVSAAEALFHGAERCDPMLDAGAVQRILREEWKNA